MKTLSIFVAVLLAALNPVGAMADNGLFLTASVGSAELSEDFDGFDVDTSATTVRLTLGWRFNNYFALEAGYNDFGDFEQRFTVDGEVVDVSLQADGFVLGAIGSLPLSERWTLFAKGGAFFWNGAASINNATAATPEDANIYLSAGAGFDLTQNLSLTIDGSRYELDGASSTVIAAGFKYNF